MLWCVRAALALAILVFLPGLRESFEPPKAAVVRVCGLALLAYAALTWRQRRPATALTDGAVAAWMIVEVAATAASRSPLLSLVGETMQREGLLTSLALGGIYFGARLGFSNDPPRAAPSATPATSPSDRTLDLAIVTAALAGAYALAQSMGLDPIRWEDAPIYATGGAVLRPSGTLGHPNLLGVVAAATGAAALALTVSERRGRWWRAAAGVALAWATLATLSRAAWLGAAAGAAAGIALALRARPGAGSSRRALLALAGLAVAVVAAVLVAGWGARLAARAQEMFSAVEGSGASRLEVWRAAARAWLERPLLGHGPDTFELVFPRFQTVASWRHEWGGLPFHAHSIVLQTLATRGALGMLAGLWWAAVLTVGSVTGWRRDSDARPWIGAWVALLAACAVAGLFGALGLAGATLVAVASAAIATLASTPAATTRAFAPPARSGRGPAFAALLVGAVAAAAGAVELRAAAAARSAEDWLRIARVTEGQASAAARAQALEAASLAARLSPLDDSVHRLRAEALLGSAALSPRPDAALEDAVRAARRAAELVPARAENHAELARVLTARSANGEGAAAAGADRAIDQVIHLAPRNALLLVQVARLELVLGHPDHARAQAQRVTALYPDHAPAEVMLAEAALATGDRAGAAAALRRALAGQWRGDSAAMLDAERLRQLLP